MISIWVKTEDFFGAKKKKSSIFEGIIDADIIQQNEFLFYSLTPVQNATEYSINLNNKKYFIKPYITSKFRNYFEQKGLMTIDDFVNGIQVWTTKGIKQQFREYEKINLRQLSVSNLSKLELLISFEYIANILYAIGIRKFSKTALGILVLIAAIALAYLAITNGDVSGGWTLNAEQVRVGFTRTMYPFFAGLLLSRIAIPTRIKHAFLWCSLLLALVLYMPRIGGAEHLWMNGVYESLCIIIVFPLIVYLGASGAVQAHAERRICRFLGDISYPLYLVHYPLVYFYVAWISNHKGVTIVQAWPYALLILTGSIILAYASLKWYDEPVRKWLRKKLG
ncbi:MAG: acyltransferase [Niabella sp.]